MSFDELFKGDMQRYVSQRGFNKKFHYYFRKCQTTKNPILAKWSGYKFGQIKAKRGLEIPKNIKIGKGLYLGHAYNITMNQEAIIGENCNIHKGVVIGQENRGSRKGTPTIGNRVWIGINAIVIGKITIGDDVLIAPGSFVNCDIPSHSVVFGNPCVIKHRDNATEGYINIK